MSTERRQALPAEQLPVLPAANSTASRDEHRSPVDQEGPTSVPQHATSGADMPREGSEDENTLAFEAAIWFG